ncbi:MAG: hypothetical protein IKN15_01205 [Bacteroidaceae bacterium]|nr:hypothetical protein [Bacteroidaceae bacterium]
MNNSAQKQAILDADNAKGDVIDLLAPLVCDKSRFTVKNKSVRLNVRNPITVECSLSTDFDDMRIDFCMSYNESRDDFYGTVLIKQLTTDGNEGSTPTWETLDYFTRENISWSPIDTLKGIANHILYALDLVKVYKQTAKQLADLRKTYGIYQHN